MTTINIENIKLNDGIIDRIKFLQDDGAESEIKALDLLIDCLLEDSFPKMSEGERLCTISDVRHLIKTLRTISCPSSKKGDEKNG